MSYRETIKLQCAALIAADKGLPKLKTEVSEEFYDAQADRVAASMNELIDTPPESADDLVALCDLIEHAKVAGDLAMFVRNVREFALKQAAGEPPPVRDDFQ